MAPLPNCFSISFIAARIASSFPLSVIFASFLAGF
jgi:hypothetical protein